MAQLKAKLIVSDFDNTLITSDQKVLPEVREAISRYVADGGVFAVCARGGGKPLFRPGGVHGGTLSGPGSGRGGAAAPAAGTGAVPCRIVHEMI